MITTTHHNKAQHKPSSTWTAAFTIVELFVVLAVLAVLASLLLPALSNAKRAVVRVHCKSNMRQWGIALQMYAGDNNDCFPDNLDGYRIVYYGTNAQAFLRDYLLPTSRSSTEKERNHVLFCPGDKFHRRWDTSPHLREGEPVGAGYLLLPHRDTTRRDWDYNVTGLEEWHSRMKLGGPLARAPVLVDKIQALAAITSQEGDVRVLNWYLDELPLSPHIGRHGVPLGGNFLFEDGHVIWHAFEGGRILVGSAPPRKSLPGYLFLYKIAL